MMCKVQTVSVPTSVRICRHSKNYYSYSEKVIIKSIVKKKAA